METWLLLRSPAANAAFNMAADETLLQHVRHLQQPVLRLYSWSEPAASFGYFQRFADVSRATPLRPLVRRPTGGGIVPHDHDWTYSVAFPPTHAWYSLKATESYHRVHEWVRSAFEQIGIAATLASGRDTTPLASVSDGRDATPLASASPAQCFSGAEQFDVLAGQLKIAGAAQRRTRDGLLIQGSIQPRTGMQRDAWETALRETATTRWQIKWRDWPLPSELENAARQLAHDKYSTAAYNERR